MGGIFPDPGGHATSKKSRYGLRIAKFCDDDGRLLVNDPRRGTGRCRKIDHGIDLRENTPFTFYRIRGRTVPLGEFLTEVPVDEILKYRRHPKAHPKAKDRDYFKPSEIARMAGLSRDTIARMFWNDPGIRKTPYTGRNRRTYVTMLISKAAAKRRF